MTIGDIDTASPFPWTQQVNFNGIGGVRMMDAKNIEVPLFTITAVAIWATTKMAGKTKPQSTTEAAAT